MGKALLLFPLGFFAAFGAPFGYILYDVALRVLTKGEILFAVEGVRFLAVLFFSVLATELLVVPTYLLAWCIRPRQLHLAALVLAYLIVLGAASLFRYGEKAMDIFLALASPNVVLLLLMWKRLFGAWRICA
jgi:hypothetical protein